MARHDQRPARQTPPQCKACRFGFCNECIDIARIALGSYVMSGPACGCKNDGHGGEPRDKQVADPFDGSVHAPGLMVTTEGEVKPQ